MPHGPYFSCTLLNWKPGTSKSRLIDERFLMHWLLFLEAGAVVVGVDLIMNMFIITLKVQYNNSKWINMLLVWRMDGTWLGIWRCYHCYCCFPPLVHAWAQVYIPFCLFTSIFKLKCPFSWEHKIIEYVLSNSSLQRKLSRFQSIYKCGVTMAMPSRCRKSNKSTIIALCWMRTVSVRLNNRVENLNSQISPLWPCITNGAWLSDL